MICNVKNNCLLLVKCRRSNFSAIRICYKSVSVFKTSDEPCKHLLVVDDSKQLVHSCHFSHILQSDKINKLKLTNSSLNAFASFINQKHTVAEKIVQNSGPLQPYLKLMRLHKPVGSAFLFWPFTWGLAAATPAGTMPDLHALMIFYLLCVTMRSAGCTANDMWDKNIDSQVSRTKDRPLANNDLSYFDALVLLGGQLGFGCLVLLQYNFPTIILSVLSLGLLSIYPATKRLVPWPQFVLGLAMNFTVIIGAPVLTGHMHWISCLPLYLSGICWTMVYDTFYAFQDMDDDKKLGLKSSALSFSESPRFWLSGFGAGMISSLIACGLLNEQMWPYYVSVSAISAILAKQILTLDIHNKQDCGKKFSNQQYVGLILFLGITLGTLIKPVDIANGNNNNKDTTNASRNFLTSEITSVDSL